MAQTLRMDHAVLPSHKAGESLKEFEEYINRYGHSAVGAAYGGMNLHNVYAGGQQVAGLDEAGKLDVLSRLTAFCNSDSGSTQVTVQAGEKLRDIAQRVYGNANLWYVLAEANALSETDTLAAGITLTVPEVKTSSNDSTTFKPYNPSEITGPTTPGLPYIEPPPQSGCNGVMMVLMAVVAVVVSVFVPVLAPAMSAALGVGATAGTVAAGFVVGTATSAVAQGVGSALGATSFSWRQVAMEGATAALTAGLANGSAVGKIAKVLGVGGSRFATGAISGVLGNLGNQAIQRAVGMETHFSWRSVAASAISSGISASVTPHLTKGLGETESIFTAGMIGGVVSLHTRRAMGLGDRIDYGAIAADAFGNALGSAAAGRRTSFLSAAELQDSGVFSPNWINASGDGGMGDGSSSVGWWNLAQRSGAVSSFAQADVIDGTTSVLAPLYRTEDGRVLTQLDLDNVPVATTYRPVYGGSGGTQLPRMEVRADPWLTQYFFEQYDHALENNLPAPRSADRRHLDVRRKVLDDTLRPAWNGWAAENQAFYRAQGIGVDIGREGIPVEGRNDWRDIKAMGTFIRGGIESTINGLAVLGQMSPVGITAAGMKGEFWQPFKIEGSLEVAGAISFGVASLFVGGTPLLAGKIAPELGAAGKLSQRVNSWSDLGVGSALKGLDDLPNNFGANSAVNRTRLNSQLIADEVASGHAYAKHVVERGEFAEIGITTKPQYSDFVESVVNNLATPTRYATDGTTYYLDDATRTIVIRSQRGEATAFRPDFGIGWQNYIDTQVPRNVRVPAFDPVPNGRY